MSGKRHCESVGLQPDAVAPEDQETFADSLFRLPQITRQVPASSVQFPLVEHVTLEKEVPNSALSLALFYDSETFSLLPIIHGTEQASSVESSRL